MNQQPVMQQPQQQQPAEAPKSNLGMLLGVLIVVAIAGVAVWYFYVR